MRLNNPKKNQKMNNKFIDFQSLTSDEFIQLFCQLVAEEIPFRRVNNLDRSYLKLKYENKLFDKEGKIIPVAVAGYADRLMPLMKKVKEAQGQVRVLDVGCGCGSEALLLSLLGVDVIGIDLVPYGVDYARSRIAYYQSFSKNLLRIQFLNSDVFKYLKGSERFNIIWQIEAISHVHPAEKFLRLAFNSLYADGVLIVSDSNALNPVSVYRSCRLRRSLICYTYKQPYDKNCAEPVEVAEERIFSIFSLKNKLIRAGFKIEIIQISGFMGSYIFPKNLLSKQRLSNMLIFFQSIMKKVPILRLLGSNFTIVAKN